MPSISITKQRHILDMIQSAAQNSVKSEDYTNAADQNEEFLHHRHLLCMGAWIALGEATPSAWQINIASGRTDRMFERPTAPQGTISVAWPQRNVLGTNPVVLKCTFQAAEQDNGICCVCGKTKEQH